MDITSALGDDGQYRKDNSIGDKNDILEFWFSSERRSIGDYRMWCGYSVRAVCP